VIIEQAGTCKYLENMISNCGDNDLEKRSVTSIE
jgi:hypothetical protein